MTSSEMFSSWRNDDDVVAGVRLTTVWTETRASSSVLLEEEGGVDTGLHEVGEAESDDANLISLSTTSKGGNSLLSRGHRSLIGDVEETSSEKRAC